MYTVHLYTVIHLDNTAGKVINCGLIVLWPGREIQKEIAVIYKLYPVKKSPHSFELSIKCSILAGRSIKKDNYEQVPISMVVLKLPTHKQ